MPCGRDFDLRQVFCLGHKHTTTLNVDTHTPHPSCTGEDIPAGIRNLNCHRSSQPQLSTRLLDSQEVKRTALCVRAATKIGTKLFKYCTAAQNQLCSQRYLDGCSPSIECISVISSWQFRHAEPCINFSPIGICVQN